VLRYHVQEQRSSAVGSSGWVSEGLGSSRRWAAGRFDAPPPDAMAKNDVMKLLLITGAGASRNLNSQDSSPIMLMDEWAPALRDLLGPALSELLGLHHVVTGQDFEAHLGELMRWLSLKPFNKKFAWMTSGTDSGRDQSVVNFTDALGNAERRGERLQQTLDESLFEQFGPARFDSGVAGEAYDRLLSDAGGGNRPGRLICATTNYDRSLELALASLNIQPRTGFRYDGIRVPTLTADALGSYETQPSILYLHGAVGWYRDDRGSIVAYPAEERYRPEFGQPAVLYPSLNKAIGDGMTAQIWVEFDRALRDATHVLVVGHGLADEHLVQRLTTASAAIGVTYLTDADQKFVGERVPNAVAIKMEFGPTPHYDRAAMAAWRNSED